MTEAAKLIEEGDALRAAAMEYAEIERAAETVTDDDDQTYFIGKRDGYGEAVQTIDCATGGDGEYFFSTFGDDCADPPAMIEKIVERFAALSAEVKRLREALEGTTAAHTREIVALYDRLARINDEIEVGDDGYARFASLNDRDHLREIVRELELRGLFQRGEQ